MGAGNHTPTLSTNTQRHPCTPSTFDSTCSCTKAAAKASGCWEFASSQHPPGFSGRSHRTEHPLGFKAHLGGGWTRWFLLARRKEVFLHPKLATLIKKLGAAIGGKLTSTNWSNSSERDRDPSSALSWLALGGSTHQTSVPSALMSL